MWWLTSRRMSVCQEWCTKCRCGLAAGRSRAPHSKRTVRVCRILPVCSFVQYRASGMVSPVGLWDGVAEGGDTLIASPALSFPPSLHDRTGGRQPTTTLSVPTPQPSQVSAATNWVGKSARPNRGKAGDKNSDRRLDGAERNAIAPVNCDGDPSRAPLPLTRNALFL